MAAQNLRPNQVSMTILFPVLDKFHGTELPEFFAKVRHNHDFEQFEQMGDEGAHLETDGARRLEIDRGSLYIIEYPRVAIDAVKKNVVDLVSAAEEHFGLYTTQVARARIRGTLEIPTDGPDVFEVIKGVVDLADDQYAHLGDPERASLRFVGHRKDPDMGWNIEILPNFDDPYQFELRLETHPHYETQRVEAVGDFLSLSYEFLDQNVVHFINTFLA